ncbi:MAG: M20/M25/M40 family metallo-hydrolase [Myxococcota bacterium]
MLRLTPVRLAITVWCVAVVACVLRFRPPALEGDQSEHFAGQHAHETLRRLLPDDRPHPLGSDAHVAMRARIEAEIRALGYEPTVREHWSCSRWGQCGRVRNITFEIPGERHEAVLFVAHSDSAMAGPGAADDAHAVAILLELARHIQRGTATPRNTIAFLISDGEEEGMLGAGSFVEHDPLAGRVGVAVNLEARGNAGISMLFQALGEDAWLIDAYGQYARAPYSTSLAQVVYELMPNYTDLTVLRGGGIAGVDFAFIDGVSAYHSPLDTVDNLSPGALQTQGDNALAMLRGLGSADLRDRPSGHSAWFDLLGVALIRIPRGAVFPIALASFLLVLGGCVVLRRQDRVTARSMGAAAGIAALVILGAGLGGALLSWAVSMFDGESGAVAVHPWPSVVAMGLVAIAVQIAMVRGSTRSALETIAGLLLWVTTLGVPMAWFAPGAAYLLVMPPLVFGVTVAVVSLGRASRWSSAWPWGCAVAGFVSLALWLPTLHGLRLALGVNPGLAVVAALAGLWCGPLWVGTDRRVAPTFAAGAVIVALSTLALGGHDAEHPRRQWLTRVLGADGSARVLRAPGAVADARLRIKGDELGEEAHEAAAEIATLPPPQMLDATLSPAVTPGRQPISVLLQSPRGAPSIIVSIPKAAGLQELYVEDAVVPLSSARKGATRVEIHAVPTEGVRIEAILEDPRQPWRIADRSPWLDPPTGLRAPDAHRSWDGDTTWVVAEAALQ